MLSISISGSLYLSLSLHRLSVFAFIDSKTDAEEFLREDLRLMYVFPGAVYSFNGRSIVILSFYPFPSMYHFFRACLAR